MFSLSLSAFGRIFSSSIFVGVCILISVWFGDECLINYIIQGNALWDDASDSCSLALATTERKRRVHWRAAKSWWQPMHETDVLVHRCNH